MIVTEQHPALLDFACRVLGVQFDPAQSTWIGQVEEGYISAVVVYTRFSRHNCEMSIATDGRKRWASRDFLRACYSYPFQQLGLARITVVVEDDNRRSLRLCRKLGHVEEGLLRGWFGNKDGILMRMLRDECRWIEPRGTK